MLCNAAISQLLAVTSLVMALTTMEGSNEADVDGNTTINVGYFLQFEPRIAAIGMAIDQFKSEGRLTNYVFE
jgi:hypothetical protein